MNSNEQAVRQLYYFAEAATMDVKAFSACFTPEAEFVNMATGVVYHGHDEVWKPTVAFATAFPDMHREVHRMHSVGDVVVVELSLQGTHRGPLQLEHGSIAPTGRTMNAPCCDIFYLVDGKVRLFNCYNEASVILAQLGVLGNLEAAVMTEQQA